MLNILLIYDLCEKLDEHSYENRSLGGSETWLVQLSKYLAKLNINITVLCYTDEYHIDNNRVKWIPIQKYYHETINHNKYDLVIISRNLDGVVNDIAKSQCTKHILLQAHDFCLYRNGNLLRYEDEEMHHPLVKGFVALTENHKQIMIKYFQIPENKIFVIGNGVDVDLINSIEEPEHRDNGVLFSSRPERGLKMLIEEIAPEVRKEIPDFYVEFSQYEQSSQYENQEHVYNLGCLTKTELYKHMKKHKVWFYPGVYRETFCITALETALCGNELVTPYKAGIGSTFMYFNHTGTEHDMYDGFQLSFETKTDNEKCKKELIELLIKSIKDYDNKYLSNTRKIRQKYVEDKFTWECIAQQWKILIEKIIREN